MISTLSILAFGLAISISLAPRVFAVAIPHNTTTQAPVPGVLSFPIAAVHHSRPSDGLTRRGLVAQIDNHFEGLRYVISFDIGTPPQPVSVAIDTGSSNTWVNPNCDNAGGKDEVAYCQAFPRFDPTKSSSFQYYLRGKGSILSFQKGEAAVRWGQDMVYFGPEIMPRQMFAVAQNSHDFKTGVLGLGSGKEFTGYSTFLDTMAEQEVIPTRAFSVSLGSWNSPFGSVVFGGLDTGKYSGKLGKVPIIPAEESPDGISRYWVYLNSISITVPGEAPRYVESNSFQTAQKGLPVILDTGSSLSQLPKEIVEQLLTVFPSAGSFSNGFYYVDCEEGTRGITINFAFGNTTVKVPVSEFLLPPDNVSKYNSKLCIFGAKVQPPRDVLGSSVLRAAFVTFDQDHQNIYIGQAADCGVQLFPITPANNYAAFGFPGLCNP